MFISIFIIKLSAASLRNRQFFNFTFIFFLFVGRTNIQCHHMRTGGTERTHYTEYMYRKLLKRTIRAIMAIFLIHDTKNGLLGHLRRRFDNKSSFGTSDWNPMKILEVIFEFGEYRVWKMCSLHFVKKTPKGSNK